MHMRIYEPGVLITKATGRKGHVPPSPAPTMSVWNSLGMPYPDRGQMPVTDTHPHPRLHQACLQTQRGQILASSLWCHLKGHASGGC